MRSKKVRTTDCSSVGRANFPSLLDNPAHPFSSSSPLSLSLLDDDRFQSSLLRFVNETGKQTDHFFKPIFKVVDVSLYYLSSRPFFPTQTKTSFFKKKKRRDGRIIDETPLSILHASPSREKERENYCFNLGQLAR